MKLYYDFHIHSCLSPCGDDDNTPNNIAGMAYIKGLDVIAVTDHNSLKNCSAVSSACRQYGITVIPGAEVTTNEDIHAICLFPNFEIGEKFQDILSANMNYVENNEEIFGKQIIMDENDQIIGCEKALLVFAINLSIDQLFETVSSLGGVCIPAHIDKQSNSIIAVLGDIPKNLKFSCIELSKKSPKNFPNYGCRVVRSSDAHYLQDIAERENYIEVSKNSAEDVINYLK